MRLFKLTAYLIDQDKDFDYRYGKMLTLDHIMDDEEWEIMRDNLIGYLDAVRAELKDELEGEQYGNEGHDESFEPNLNRELL
jgi:hypothetical protein